MIGYTPIISNLMKEWYCFHFLNVADVDAILKGPWVFRRSFLAFYRWYIGYDPLKNTPSNNLIWVKLPNLPREMWSKEILEEIGNSIGRFVYVDPWCLGEKDKRIAWILIEKAYREGYPDHIEITWRDLKINQRLDFWGIPFRCAACHKIGHLIKNCPRHLAPKSRVFHRKARINSSSASLSLTELLDEHHPINLDPKVSSSPQVLS